MPYFPCQREEGEFVLPTAQSMQLPPSLFNLLSLSTFCLTQSSFRITQPGSELGTGVVETDISHLLGNQENWKYLFSLITTLICEI